MYSFLYICIMCMYTIYMEALGTATCMQDAYINTFYNYIYMRIYIIYIPVYTCVLTYSLYVQLLLLCISYPYFIMATIIS